MISAGGDGWVVVMAIGLNLAPIAVKSVSASAFDSWMAVMTVRVLGWWRCFTQWHDPAVIDSSVGLIVACLLYGVMTNVLGAGKKLSILLSSAMLPWVSGLPHFSTPAFNGQAMMLDCARGGDSGGGKLRSSQGSRRDDWTQYGPVYGAGICRRWSGNDAFPALSAVAA